MSVLFLPPASAASVPDATETVSGKIRIATSAEATTGTNDLTAMTPLKVKSVVDAAVVGGVTYQGTFDTSSPVDLSNAEKGDLYIISVAGSYQGQTWAVGDHLLVNADMGGTISPSKIDKVDNTDAVTSVAGKTGAVTLVAGDVSGLAAVATSGAYSDLSGTPTLAAVATSGAYSDLSGTPTLGTAAAEDVGTAASNVVQLDGSARLPAVDGSQLLNLPSSPIAALDDIGDVAITSVSDREALVYDSGTSQWVNGSAANTVIESFSATPASTVVIDTQDLYEIRMTGAGGFTVTISATADGLGAPILFDNQSSGDCTLSTVGSLQHFVANGQLSGSQTTTIQSGERRLFYALNSSRFLEMNATNLDRLADVSLSSPSAGEALVYNGTLSAFQNATVSASVPSASETVEGIIEIATNAEATAASATDKALVPSNLSSINVSTLNNDAGYKDTAFDVIAVTGTTTLSSSLDDGHYLVTVDGAHTVTIPAYSADANIVFSFRHINTGAGDATIYYNTGQSQLFEYDTNTGQFSLSLSDSGAMRSFALRWTGSAASSQYWYELQPSSLNSLPDVSYTAGAGIDNYVLTYDHSTGLWGAEPSAGGGSTPAVNSAAPSAPYTITTNTGIEEIWLFTPTLATSAQIPAASTAGSGYKYNIKNLSTHALTVTSASGTIDGAANFILSVQYSSITVTSDGTNWFIL